MYKEVVLKLQNVGKKMMGIPVRALKHATGISKALATRKQRNIESTAPNVISFVSQRKRLNIYNIR